MDVQAHVANRRSKVADIEVNGRGPWWLWAVSRGGVTSVLIMVLIGVYLITDRVVTMVEVHLKEVRELEDLDIQGELAMTETLKKIQQLLERMVTK